jgi:hypothetical protein
MWLVCRESDGVLCCNRAATQEPYYLDLFPHITHRSILVENCVLTSGYSRPSPSIVVLECRLDQKLGGA